MPETQGNDTHKLIETVREALEAMKAEWSILPKSATFRIEDITEWLIRFVDPHMKRIDDALDALSRLESALGEKTVPMAMLEDRMRDDGFQLFCKDNGFIDIDPQDRPHIYNMRVAWNSAWRLVVDIVLKHMPGYTVK